MLNESILVIFSNSNDFGDEIENSKVAFFRRLGVASQCVILQTNRLHSHRQLAAKNGILYNKG